MILDKFYNQKKRRQKNLKLFLKIKFTTAQDYKVS